MNLRYGKADENVLKRSVADVILHERQKFREHRNHLNRENIGAAWNSSAGSGGSKPEIRGGRNVLCAVSLSKNNIGGLAAVRAVNRLAAEKTRALVFCPAILLPIGTQEEKLRKIIKEICMAAFSMDVEVKPGDIEVTDAVTRPVVTGSAFGIPFSANGSAHFSTNDTTQFCANGLTHFSTNDPAHFCANDPAHFCANGSIHFCANDSEHISGERPNFGRKMEIVAAGWIGMEGTLVLTADCREKLRQRFPASLLARTDFPPEELCVLRAAEIAAEEGAGPLVNLSDGGFMAGLWELSKKADSGLEINLEKVPILQETIEITEFFGVNPYLMKSEGCLLIAARDGYRLTDRLIDEGIFAAKIGFLNETKDKIIRNGEDIRHLDRPQTDSLAQFFYEHPEDIAGSSAK